MDLGVISVRYARALLKSATQQGIENQVYNEAQTLSDSYSQVAELCSTIDKPMLQKDAKLRLLIIASGGEGISELMQNFLKLVLKEGREAILQFMARSYVTLYRKQKNIIRGKLTTAIAVSRNIESKMQKMVEAKTQGTVEFVTEIDPDIIGGFILEYDTYKMDASVKSKLRSILSQLKK